jgi:hypothetical protein
MMWEQGGKRCCLLMVTSESNLVIFITLILLSFSNSFSRISCLPSSYLLFSENKEGWGQVGIQVLVLPMDGRKRVQAGNVN